MRERRGGKTRHDTGRGGREKGCNAGELGRGKVNITILYTCEIFKKLMWKTQCILEAKY